MLTIATLLISITVLNPMAQPVSGAFVLVDSLGCTNNVESCVTDSAGKMVFEIMPGKRLVTVSKNGYKTWVGAITFVPERPNAKIVLLPEPVGKK